MKRGLLIFAVALVAGLAAFFITRSRCGCEMAEVRKTDSTQSRLPALEWLRSEFQLSDEQFTQVSALHLAYQPTCDDLCQKIMTSQQKVTALTGAGTTVTPELKATLLEHATLRAECQTALLDHLYQTAACMSADNAHHYLREMLPEALDMPMTPEATRGSH